MRRTTVRLIGLLAVGLLTATRTVAAPPSAKVPRVGVLLFSGPDSATVETLRQELREHGWVEGQNLAIVGGLRMGMPSASPPSPPTWRGSRSTSS